MVAAVLQAKGVHSKDSYSALRTVQQSLRPADASFQPVTDYISATSLLINETETEDFFDPPSPPDMFDTDTRRCGFDTRASACISPFEPDFVPGTLVPTNKKVKTFAGIHTGTVMKGTLRWTVQDRAGQVHVFEIPESYYIPGGDMRLFSPQHWAQMRLKMGLEKQHLSPHVDTTAKQMIMEWNGRKSQLIIDIDPRTNVGNFAISPGYSKFHLFLQEAGLDTEENIKDPLVIDDTAVVSDDEEDSVNSDTDHPDDWIADWTSDSEGETSAEQPREIDFTVAPEDGATSQVVEQDEEDHLENVAAQLLRIHHNSNHLGFGKLRALAKCGVLPKKFATCAVPVCSACMFGKATRRPWRDKPKSGEDKPSVPITRAGQCVSVDMLKSPTPGLIAQMAGWITGKRYNYATVFVDHFTRLSYVHLQKTQTAKETLEGKALWERKLATFGIKVQHYHADNGVFNSLAWKEACAASLQGYSYSGVNAHFQSGIAERRIKELQELTRTILIHAEARWQEAITVHLWPYALRLANEQVNEAPTGSLKRSPIELLTKSSIKPEPKHWKPFGCPVYVLDSALQSAGGIKHKWSERARVGVYLGRSPFHARSVALVLNLQTGRVSPQFHVRFDPSFHTMKKSFGGKSPPSMWQAVCGFAKAPSMNVKNLREPKQGDQREPTFTLEPTASQREMHHEPQVRFEDPDPVEQDPVQGETSTSTEAQRQPATEDSGLRRSTRVSKPVIGNRLVDALATEIIAATTPKDSKQPQQEHDPVCGELFSYSTLFPIAEEEDEDPISAYAASADPDTLYYHEAMKEPDAAQFQEAMVKEFVDQWDNGNFILKKRSEIPSDARILPGVWAMKRKRRVLTGECYKHKARLNLDGSRQIEGLDYDQTYSPTASWPAVRLQLALTLVNNWFTKQIDYVQAFPQAPIQVIQYMKIPKGIDIDGVVNPEEWVLEVHKNVYGGKAAGRQWYLHLKDKLESIGFTISRFDECVFFKGSCMYVLYTDDSILAGPSQEEVESILAEIEQAKLGITDEGDISDFLGVHVERVGDEFHLTQPKLIESIIEDLNLNQPSTKSKDTPMASSKLLSRHPDSTDFDGSFNYRRVIGKLNFLEQSTRGDISYATHMLARFCSNPKVEHGNAARWLGRYLLGTKDKGLIMRPDPTKGLELYCDADFAGAWDPELAGEDIDTARSRHGYILTYAGVPILWKSQMQGEIALSSTESEFIGLSSALRKTIPLHRMLNEMKELGFNIVPNEPVIHCTAFEDNNGALAIASVPRMRPRTKHINNKYFHFMEYTSREGAPFSFERIDTESQPADMLTKPLAVDLLVRHRKWLLGW